VSQPPDEDLAALYHLNSSATRPVIPDPPGDPAEHVLAFRTYPGAERIDLPGRDFDLAPGLGATLKARVSTRDFVDEPMGLEDLGRLLHASYGTSGFREIEGYRFRGRPMPSAGGLYPLEIYLSVRSVRGLAPGLYHYDARAHQLEVRQRGDFTDQVADMAYDQPMLGAAAVVLVISAVWQRTMWKYRQRGYRFVLLDAGHLGQNLYLVATALGLGACAGGGFYDAEMSRLLGLPAGEEAIYLICAGRPA
jgi:SagB-type dehydrogenase family enzyme